MVSELLIFHIKLILQHIQVFSGMAERISQHTKFRNQFHSMHSSNSFNSCIWKINSFLNILYLIQSLIVAKKKLYQSLMAVQRSTATKKRYHHNVSVSLGFVLKEIGTCLWIIQKKNRRENKKSNENVCQAPLWWSREHLALSTTPKPLNYSMDSSTLQIYGVVLLLWTTWDIKKPRNVLH